MTTPPLLTRLPVTDWRRRVSLFAIAAALVLGGTYLAAALRREPAPAAPAIAERGEPNAPALDGGSAAIAGGLLPPGERVAFWELRVTDPAGGVASPIDLVNLADAYLDRSRATGDLGDLQRAQTALERAATTTSDLAAVQARQAQVAFSLHEWGRSLAIASELLDRDPNNLAALGVSGDALLETGDLEGARTRYATLASLAPSPAVWSRLGRMAFLTGDTDDAIRLVAQAADTAEEDDFPDAAAFYRFQLGELYRSSGELDEALGAYDRSLSWLPNYPPATLGRARVLDAVGRRADAIALLEAAVERLPQPEAVALLGDLYALSAQPELAERQYALVDRIGELGQANGTLYDRQLVLIAADHDRDVADAVRRARAELVVRPDIYGHDALAWALYKAGALDEAAAEAQAAMALGTRDPRLAYHAGMIAAAQGRTDDARGLLTTALGGAAYLPPLQVPVLEATLAGLAASGVDQ
jgi:tetratricopeptide (TPR) repeat protein